MVEFLLKLVLAPRYLTLEIRGSFTGSQNLETVGWLSSIMYLQKRPVFRETKVKLCRHCSSCDLSNSASIFSSSLTLLYACRFNMRNISHDKFLLYTVN